MFLGNELELAGEKNYGTKRAKQWSAPFLLFLPSFLLSPALAVLLVVGALSATPVLAVDVDLEAVGIEFSPSGSDYEVGVQDSIMAAGPGLFQYTVKLEQYRDGVLIATLINEQQSAEEDSARKCSFSCDGRDCGVPCRLIIDLVFTSGTCSDELDCPTGGYRCGCRVTGRIGEVIVEIRGGDVFSLSITPGQGANDLDLTNNTYETTF